MRITVDGAEQPILDSAAWRYSPEWSCANSCARAVYFDLRTYDLGDFGGQHEIKIEAWDALGHATVKTLRPTYYPTSVRFGGIDGRVNSVDEVRSYLTTAEASEVGLGDDLWRALMASDRTYVAAQALAIDPQQMCREEMGDNYDAYEYLCKHEDRKWADDDPIATVAAYPAGWDDLNDAEKSFCRLHRLQCRMFQRDFSLAYRMMTKLFTGTSSEHDADSTMANAFLHSYATALMANSVNGSLLAYDFVRAHEERWEDASDSVPRRKSRLDMLNNRVGWWWANEHGFDDSTACKAMFSRVTTGDYIDPALDPFTEYERRGYASNLGTWSKTTKVVWRKLKTRPEAGRSPVTVTYLSSAPCDGL
jgi:hypothetical protein